MSHRWVRILMAFTLLAAAPGAFLIPAARSEAPPLPAGSVKAIAPKLVTVQQKDAPLSEALHQFAKQTGVEVLLPAAEDPKVSLELKDVPFWKALDDIARSADMRVYPYLRDGKLSLQKGQRDMPTCYSGPFRVVLKSITVTRDLETGGHSARASLEVAWPPAFQAFLLETQPSGFVVQDDSGKALEVPHIGKGQGPVYGKSAVVLDLPLPAVPRAVPRLGLIKGELSVVGAAKMLTFSFDKLKEGKSSAQEGVSVELKEVHTQSKERWSVLVHLKYPPGGPRFGSFQAQTWQVGNRAFLVKRDQRVPVNAGSESLDAPAGEALIRYYFENDSERKVQLGSADLWGFEYRTPSPLLEVAIPFEFKDVPLP